MPELDHITNINKKRSFFIVATYPHNFCWTYSKYVSNTQLKSFVYEDGFISSEDGLKFLKIENNQDISFTTIKSEATKVEIEYTNISTNFRIKFNNLYIRHCGTSKNHIYCEAESNNPFFKSCSTWIFIPNDVDEDHEFVIAALDENINWIRYLPGRVSVYYKSNNNINFDHRDNIKVLRAQNIGREAHSYLYHITINFNKTLAERTTFLQGDPFPHSPNILELCCMSKDYDDVQSLSCWYTYTDARSIPDKQTIKNSLQYLNGARIAYFNMLPDGSFETFKDDGWLTRHNAYMNRSPQDLMNLNPIEYFYKFLGIHNRYQKEFLMIICAMFSVKKANILQHNKNFYNMLIRYLFSTDQQGGFEVYVLERLWYTLFSLDSET